MKAHELREKFLAYFESKGHTRVPSASLVPAHDPTLLFSNAGMNQFKECFLGLEQRAYKRATSSQKCLRISGKHNDFENVGVTARHHTFFEMLGNFSFGDYFKAEAIEYGWEFVTEVLGFSKSRLWATVYEEDDEAAKLWAEKTDISPDRIIRMGEKDNFWAMGDTGPCGPCSEIHYYLGEDESKQSEAGLRRDDGTYLEIWNLVFMQYERDAAGNLKDLPKPSVDTGMGLERVAAVAQGVKANYDIELFRNIISLCEELSGFKYDGASYAERDLRSDTAYARDVAMRVVADHSRAVSFLIADGVHPGSDGRAYVLRRMIRRAIRHGRVLEFKDAFLAQTTKRVIELMGDDYPELKERQSVIEKIVAAEEAKFHETLDAGLAVLHQEVKKVGAKELFPGKIAFLLHDTYGFPLDLTQDALKAYKMKVDEEAFKAEMEAQKKRSRDDRKSHDISFSAIKVEGKATKFVGDKKNELESKVSYVVPENEAAKSLKTGDKLSLFFETTPFYAEAGGQVGDTGEINILNARLAVLDTQKASDTHFQHKCEVLEGELPLNLKGKKAQLIINLKRRERIRLNHSATHILHAALRKFLGEHVKQAGSRVDEETLRFDYSHFEVPSAEQLDQIQTYVNEEIRANYEIACKEMSKKEAQKAGALAFFGDKYGERVRVVSIGPNSMELCGGTHARRSGDIGMLLIKSETGIAAGVRRIECLSGPKAYEVLLAERKERMQIAEILKSDTAKLPAKVEKLLLRNKDLEKELEAAKAKLASASSGDLIEKARVSPSGIKVIAEEISGADSATLRSMVDRLRLKLGSGLVALASSEGPKALLVAGVTSDLTNTVHAGKLVKAAAETVGGKGGGRPDFAQAGGLDASKVTNALDKLFELVT